MIPSIPTLLLALLLALPTACTLARADQSLPREDMALLRAGDLGSLQRDYAARASSLNRAQLAVLCEIYIRQLAVRDAQSCLDRLATGADKETRATVAGKRALLAYLIADHREAATLSAGLESLGGRYVNALATLRLGDPAPARRLASLYARDYVPEKVFLAANLYFALEDYAQVRAALRRPPLMMHRNYSLSGNVTISGARALEAPLRVDLFDEFRYGLFDSMSFAPPSNVYVEYLLAVSEARGGETKNAAERLARVLDYPGIDGYPELRWRAVAERAGLRLAAGQTAAALADYQAAVAGFDAVRSSIATDAGRIGFAADKREVYAALVRLLLAEGRASEAFEYSERFRSRALVDLMASVQRFGARGSLSAAEQARQLQTVSAVETSLPAIDLNLSGPGASASQRESAAATKRAFISQREHAVGQLDREVREYVEVPLTSWTEVAGALAPGELLLSYYFDGGDWWVFAVDRQRVRSIRLDPPQLASRVERLRRTMEAGTADEAVAVSLYKDLLAPVTDALGAALPARLTIVPFGVLHYLPFAALRERAGGDYLIERSNFALAMLPAARIRPFLHPGGTKDDSMLVAADPSRPDTRALTWAREELKLAQNPLDEKLVGGHASRAEFLARAPNHGILHIAAHGEFDSDSPIDSRILLAPDPERGDLTATELFKIAPPWRVRLVVLSACESALNQVSYGQEMIGLQRGLLFAGAGSIIGSLWNIDDRGTYEFMQAFYRKLRHPGQSVAGALAAAQREMIENGGNSRVWAAFTYTGIHE